MNHWIVTDYILDDPDSSSDTSGDTSSVPDPSTPDPSLPDESSGGGEPTWYVWIDWYSWQTAPGTYVDMPCMIHSEPPSMSAAELYVYIGSYNSYGDAYTAMVDYVTTNTQSIIAFAESKLTYSPAGVGVLECHYGSGQTSTSLLHYEWPMEVSAE